MKLITLNIWGGKVFDPLIRFLKSNSSEVDVFCFQEVFHTKTNRTESRGMRPNIFDEIAAALVNHKGYFAPAQDGFDYEGKKVDFHLTRGNATFVRKTIPVLTHGDIFVYGSRNCVQSLEDLEKKWSSFPQSLLYVQIQSNNNPIAIFNLHGLRDEKGKIDTEDKLNQSQKIKDCMQRFQDSKIILCGDFNLLSTTQSLSMLEANMKNLVKEYGAVSTRSSFYTKPEKLGDYILVSPDLKVNDFRVLQEEVSDHLPLLLEFE